MDPDSLQLLPVGPGQDVVIEPTCPGATCGSTCLITCRVTN
ncbi:hypothetical protein ROS62_23255 [Streptomyces sp. DSM 41972]|uniref:FxLD family lantipeptide n=1 Tax=Streptomyces althioticus subsp. attaecolombicae TaxID=3075534 RepID=A0ABU3I3W5_9ACTN|nr:hypothetical protein [Streptomyces sp. DSM 41972]